MAGDRLRVICGPTAAGKSSLALQLALEYGATIISADSRQIYRAFDIGTAKPSWSERVAIPHCGIDVAQPEERYSASRWAREATHWIAEARNNGRAALIVGGTGFYIRALFEPLFPAPTLDSHRRGKLDEYLSKRSIAELRRWCAEIDPEKVKLGRTQLVRAIETALLAGFRLSDLQERAARENAGLPTLEPMFLVVDPRASLGERIERRVDEMFNAGWVDEVRSLDGYVAESAPAWKSSGYRVMRALVRDEIGLSTARERIIIETRQYAKRQRTWFRHQLGNAAITRVDPDEPDAEAVVERWWKESS
ncbi:MAG TPA: tRNA (adenosine(37)-N6)-dimethylallyltransferase MiaA [Gemmatimonadaceae bacterium]